MLGGGGAGGRRTGWRAVDERAGAGAVAGAAALRAGTGGRRSCGGSARDHASGVVRLEPPSERAGAADTRTRRRLRRTTRRATAGAVRRHGRIVPAAGATRHAVTARRGGADPGILYPDDGPPGGRACRPGAVRPALAAGAGFGGGAASTST